MRDINLKLLQTLYRETQEFHASEQTGILVNQLS